MLLLLVSQFFNRHWTKNCSGCKIQQSCPGIHFCKHILSLLIVTLRYHLSYKIFTSESDEDFIVVSNKRQNWTKQTASWVGCWIISTYKSTYKKPCFIVLASVYSFQDNCVWYTFLAFKFEHVLEHYSERTTNITNNQ